MPYADLFSALASNIETIVSQGGYAVLFLFTLIEGMPLFGMVVPGHIAIIVAGFLAKIGTLNIWYVIALSILGAVLGDYIGFRIGRKYGITFIDRLRPYFLIKDEHIDRANDLLSRHTGKAMIIGRFTPATRALMPFLVGASETHVGKFWLYNIIGGISWTVSSILVGYIFGSGYSAAAGLFGKVVLLAVIASVILIWGYRFVNMRFHVFRRYEIFTLILNILALWTIAKLVQDNISKSPFMLNFDLYVNKFMNLYNQGGVWRDILAKGAFFITNVGGTEVTAIGGVVIAIVLAFMKRWRSSAIMFLSIGSTAVIIMLMKQLFLRVRPDNALEVIVNDPSFPSGHAGLAAAFFLTVAYLFAPKISSWIRRELFIVVCVFAAILVGLTRVILNVHWATDVIAGWSVGLFAATGSILLVRYISVLLIKKKIARN